MRLRRENTLRDVVAHQGPWPFDGQERGRSEQGDQRGSVDRLQPLGLAAAFDASGKPSGAGAEAKQ